MLTLFDLHAETECLTVLRSDPDGQHTIELRSLRGQMLGEISAELLPLGSQNLISLNEHHCLECSLNAMGESKV